MVELIRKDVSLKTFLQLFEGQEKLKIIELGDTGHPSSGFVDESHFTNVNTINSLLELEYDFNGLVWFKREIGNLFIQYESGQFKIMGSKKGIEKIKGRIKNNGYTTIGMKLSSSIE